MRRYIKLLLRLVFTTLSRSVVSEMGADCRVNFLCKFSRNTIIKNNCNFNGMEVSGKGHVVFGNNFHSGKECLIITSYHNYEGECIPYDNTYIHKDVTIEDNVWIGTRVTILGGITIGEGAIIQAGSVVVSSIPKYSIAGGAPAKVFKTRNIEHYQELKLQNRYL